MRNPLTYRSARRNEWAFARKHSVVSWREWMQAFYTDGFGVGSGAVSGHVANRGRSKYVPHESKKRGGTGPVFA
jgi:hypothetical protein